MLHNFLKFFCNKYFTRCWNIFLQLIVDIYHTRLVGCESCRDWTTIWHIIINHHSQFIVLATRQKFLKSLSSLLAPYISHVSVVTVLVKVFFKNESKPWLLSIICNFFWIVSTYYILFICSLVIAVNWFITCTVYIDTRSIIFQNNSTFTNWKYHAECWFFIPSNNYYISKQKHVTFCWLYLSRRGKDVGVCKLVYNCHSTSSSPFGNPLFKVKYQLFLMR